MKKLKKILSVLTLIVLVGSDFLTSISYALDDMLEDSVVVQTENEEETVTVETEEEIIDEEDSEDAYEDESMGEEELETENSTGDIVEEGTGEVSGIVSGEVEELTEETVEGDIVDELTGFVEELTGAVDESTETGEETVIEEVKYNEEPIIGEKTYNDVTVRVEALSGVFPEGTELKIEPIKWGNLSSLKDKLVEEKEEIKEDTTVVAFDITFRYEGEEVQPKEGEKVKVTFDYSRNEDLVKADKNKNQEVKVYHIEDKDEEGNKVAQGEEKVVDVTNKQESAEKGIAVVDVDSFSVYVVTYGNEDPEFSATLVGEDSARNNFHYKTITISDGENTYTLMDRNLGARVAWNTGTYAFNDKSNYNTEDDYYGYYYQWGNNYGFSNTQKYGNVISDAIPSNYVSSSWSTSNLGGYNLRGDTTNTESARQGPCPRGWHVPSANEWEAIKKVWCMSYNSTENCQGAGRQFAEALQMPTAGYRYYNYGKFIYASSGSNGYYWSSTSNDNSKANYLFFRSSNVSINTDDRVNGLQVRCLKNNTDAVTLYLNPNGGRVEDAIIDADEQGKVILPTATRNEYVFEGWFTSAGESEEIGDAGDEITINEDTDLYAHWSEIIPNPIVIFNNGADVTEFEVESGGTLTDVQIQQILNLTHTKATFDGWYTNPEFNQAFDLNTPITEDISLYAKWTCKEGYISLQGNGGPDMNCFQYGTLSYEDANGKEHFLMDRNLGAQEIGYGYDANSGSYGYYYQWGNNYGFGPSSTTIKSSTQVDCTNINPSTYTSSTFITGLNDFDWCSSKNDNLWGGSTDDSSNNRGLDTISSTDLARKGPCPEGWHVPSIGERQTLLIYGASLNSGTRKTGTPFNNYEMSFSNLTKFTNDFKIPIAGQLAYEGAQLSNNGGGGSVNLWSSSPDVDYDVWARHFNLNIPTFEASVNARSLRAYGFPVRCFMNELKNTLTLNAGEGTVDLGVGAQSIATIGIVKGESFIVPTPTRTYHSFDGWFVDANENGKYDEGEVMMGDAGGYTIDSMDDDLTLTAKWKVLVTYDGNGGTPDKESDFGQPGDTIILPGANHQGKVFGGWNNGTGYVGTQGDKYTLTRTETLLAQYYDYVVTFVYGNGERAADPIFVNNGDDDITLPSVLSVSGYIFDGWYDAAGNKIGDAGDPLSVNESRILYAQGHYNSIELTDDNTTTTVGSGDVADEVIGFPITMTVIENDILESPEGEELSEVEGKELAGDVTIDFGGVDAKFSHLVKVKIPVKGSRKAYVKVKHVSSESYNYDGLTRNIEASCNDGNIENSDHSYDGAYIDVEDGYVSIYTCEASNFAAFGLPKVTFELENGSGAIVVEVESGAMVSSEDIPTVTKSGYNFSGWYLTGAESAFDFSGTAITGDITLYAKWEQEGEGVTYTVTFDANRGTFADTPASQNVLGGGHATDPATLSGYKEPELPGYDFDEWWTEPRGGTQWNFVNDTVTGNITLYAHWTYKEIFGDLDVYLIDSGGSLIKYVMMDRNMGATGVYNKDFDNQNHNSFGFVYQWGNNYGFPRCNSNVTCNYSPITDTPVSVDIVENYIPSKFASSTWIGKNGGNGSSKSWHLNSGNVLKYLWGNGNTADMQGPCPDGYHVPLTSETNGEGGLFRVWGNIYDKTINTIVGKGEGFSFLSDDQELFSSQFLFPHAGNHKKGNTREQEQNMCGDYWTATPSGLDNAINMWFCKDGDNSYYDENGKFLFTNNSQRNNGSTLRCFKNSTSSANLDIVNGGKKGLITVDKVDGVATINAIKEPENTDANGTGLIFGGWYTSQNFEPSTMKTGGDILSDSVTALYAKWDCPDGLVYNSNNECISGVLVRFMDGETEYTRSVVLSGEEVRAPATNPKKAGHIFTGWFEFGAELPFVFTGTPITGNLDLYAHWEELPETEALIIVNYYLKKLDVENNVLTGGVIVYSTGVEFIGEIGDTINISGNYLTGIVGYYYDHATVFSGEDEILEDEIYLDGNKEVNMYYIPEQNQFTLNTVLYSNTDGSSENGMYYYGAKVILSGASSDDRYLWSGWIGLPEGTPNSAQTEFYMPNSAVTVTSSVKEKTYDVYTVTFKNRNGDFLWSGKVASGTTPVYTGTHPSRPSTEQVVYSFNGWYPELSPVTGDITYTALYTEAPRLYTVILTGTPAGYGTLSTGSLSKEYETAIVISGSQLTIGGTEVILTGNEGYEFQEWTGNCGYVERPICNENIIYTHPGVIEFTGSNNLIIRNPGYDLFSEANFHKDFEISFNILNLNLAGSANQATLISVKNEDLDKVWPGFTVRRGSATNYQITANGGIQSAVTVNRPAAGVNSLKIKRKNNILYISENDGEDIQIYNYTGFSDSYYFDNPIAIGSIYKEQTGQRYIKATLSDIVIKSMDTSSCSSGLVLAVTGDCQMTAKFKQVEEYPDVTVNHHWMNIGGSGYTIHETQHFSGNVGDEFTATEKVYTGFTADPNNEKTIIISGDNNSNIIDLYYYRDWGWLNFLTDPSYSATVIISGCENSTCWYGEDIQLTVVESSGYTFNSWGYPYGITLPEGVDITSKTISFTMPEMTQQQIRWGLSLSAIPYTITYHLNGGEETIHNQTGYTVQNSIIEVSDPVMSGYEFLGWTGGVIDGPQLSSPTTGLVIVVNDMGNVEVGDREYYANWTPNKYEVTGSVATGQGNMGYLSGSTSTGANLTGLYDFGTNLIFIAIPELGYVFDYWKNGDTVLSGTDLGDGKNQLTIVVNQILDIIAFFKPADNTPYTVEHYKQNLDQTGYEFAGSGTMYGTTNESTNATGADYEGFTLSGDLADYQTGIKADGSTIVRLYYDRNVYTITWNNRNGSEITTTPAVYGNHPEFARDGWPQRYRADQEVEYLFIFTGWSRSGSSEIIRELTGLTTEIVTGDTTYIAQYDQIYRFFELRYHPNGGTGNMGNQVLQLNTSGTLVPNLFTRTGYEFSGWLYSNVEEGIHNFYEDGQEVNLGRMDGVDGDREGETLLYIDLYAQWKPSTGTKFKVNCYAWNLDSSHNQLIGTTHLTGIEHVGTTNSSISINDYLWPDCLGIDGYNEGHGLSGAIVYGSDLSGGVETGWLGTTTVLADGTRRIDMYIVPKQNNYFVTLTDNCGSKGSLDGTYYYGAKINLEASPYECYSFSGWIGDNLPNTFDKTSAIAEFYMPNNYVIATPTVRENTYNIIFSGNGSTSGTMPGLSVLCTSGVLSQNAFEREGYTFAGWSTTSTGTVEFGDESEVYRLNTEDDGSVTLYAVWNINDYKVTGSVAEGQENMGYLSGNTLTGISLTGLYDYGTELIFIAVPELGYVFDYWEVNGGTGENLPEGATVSGNQLTVIVDQILGIVAHFTENIKTVTINYYEMNTGGLYSDDPYNTDNLTGLVGQTKSINPEFRIGFHLDNNRSNTGITISENSGDNVINIYYARDKHYITLGYSGAFIYPNSIEVVPALRESGYYYGENVHFEAIVSTGYVFKQWRVNGNPIAGNADGVDFVIGTDDMNLVVDGDPISYRIFYHGIGGSDYPDNPSYYTALSGMFLIIDPVKTGYTFLGWTGGITGDWISTPTSGLRIDVSNGLGDREYYANWETHEKNIIVNYYEMDTSGNYIYDPTHDYPNERYYYTGLVDSTFTVPDYSKTGFSFQYSIFRGNTGYDTSITFEVSENDSENIINVYYQRARNSLQIYSYNGSKYDVGPNCQSYDGGYTHSCSYYYGTEITINNYIYEYDEGYSFSGWNIDSEYSLPDDAYLSDEHIIFSMPDHSVIIRLETNHILYKLTFTGYEGAEVMNYDSTYVSLTGENYYRFDSEIELPYLDKPGYNFIGWNSGDYNEWSTYYSSNPNHPIRHMPSHDVELTAVFEPRTNMEYYKYYYFQDTEGSGYSLSGYDRYEDGITDQRVSSNCNYVEGFTHSRGEPDILYIKATGDNYINCYYDRDEYWVDVIYDNKELSITGTGKYRYDAPVNLVATANTGYEFSGFSSEWPEYNTTGSTLSFNVPLWGPASIYADANPIEYSIEYEMYGGWLYPYQRYITGYTVEDEMYFFDGAKDGYTFLGWTGGVIGVWELTEPTTGLIIPLGSIGNRKYFANFEATGSNVTVNYYLKKIDPENNVLTGEVDEYISKGVVYTGLTDSVVDIHTLYGTGIEGYEYTTAIVYGSDSMDGIETGTTTILGDGTRSIDIYYTPKKYNFTVIQGQNTTTSGTSISTGYYFGAYVTLSGDSTDNCFVWDKWGSSDLPEGKNQQHTTFEMPSHNITVESMVSEKSYNIAFDANGGTGTMSTLSVQCTTGTLSPNNFERNGYTFIGWSSSPTGEVEFSGGANVHRLSTTSGGEVTLFAIWDVNEYAITGSVAEGQENMGYLSGNTGTGISLTGLYDYGTELIFVAVPELGYLFDYWEVTGSGDSQPIVTESGNQLTVIVDQILDIVAHFTENAKTVSVNYYEMNTGGVYPGVTNSTIFTGLVGYTGYATINIPYGFHLDTTQTISTGIVISNNDSENVINIYYARNQHQLNKFYSGDFQYNYNLVDFNPILKQYYYYGEHIYTNVIVHTGYSVNILTCSGGDNINIHGTEIEFDMGDKDATIIIDGNNNRYRIDYYLDGGVENPAEPNVTGYTIIDGSIQIHDPIKTGYNFLGWTGGMSGDRISTPKSGLIIDVENGLGDRQYYANWTGMEYIVTLYVEPETGGTVYGSGVYHYGDLISVWAMTNEGYDFTGWYTYEGYNKISDYYQIGLQADDSGGTGLIAKFELRNHYLEVIPNDWTKGSYYPEYKDYYQYGTIVPVSANPNPGYQIRGWKWNPSEDYITTGEDNHIYTGLNIDVNITWDTSIYVDFEPETYNITYMYSGEILSGDIFIPSTYTVEQNICGEYIPDGSCMYYLPIYSKDGYDFTGWYYDEGTYSYSKVGLLTGMGDITLYAGLIPTTYRVYYHLGSGETLPEWYIDNYDEYTIESGRTYLPEPKKQGYDFLGWKNDNNQIITGFGGGMMGNLDLYPIWTGKVMNIEVRYHEMDTNGQYPREWSSIYYTGVIDSTFNIPDYTSTGFSQDRINYPYQPSSIVVSGNDYANVVDVYYKRETYWLDTSGIRRLLPEIDSGVTFAEVIPNKQESGNQYYFGEEIMVNLLFNDGWSFTGWYDATEEDMGFPPDEVGDLTVRNISFHMPAHDVKIEPLMEHIPYVLSFTGYEGADVSEYYPGVEDQEIYFGYHAYLPYLNKSGYWFNGWKDEYGNFEWRTGDPYPSEPILQKMPSHDYELIADFSPRTDMGYAEYYYLQDIEGSGYSLSGDLTTWWLDGVTEQLIPKRYPTVTGFDLPRYWIDGQDLPYDSLGPVINATGENFINYYYDRLTYLIDVDYDSSKMLITGTGEYRYDAPVVLTATVKTGYEFSGFVSENPEYNTTGSTLSFNVPYNFVSGYPPIIHAYAKPIVYSIDYEMNGGHFVPYNWAKTGYTVDGDFDLDIFDAGKEGYTFLGWTGGVIGVRELTEPTTGLIIPLGSIGNRKYFANFEATGSNVTVNYYLKKIDPENNVLTGGIDEYLMGVVYTGLTDTVIDIHALYGTGIEGYEYTTAIVYGSDLSGGIETDSTTILGDGSRVIDIYYTPKKYNFTVIQGQNSTTSGTSISTGYYFGAYVILSGGSLDNCFEWDKWGSQTLPEGKNQQHTTFEMPAHNVIVESMVKEKSYNIVFNANGGTGMMSTLSVQCTTGTLAPNKFERDGYTFTGWSRNAEGPVEFTGESDIHRLSTESGGEVTLFAIWDVNWYTVTFDLNGGSLTGDMTLTIDYTIETLAISLENYIPIKTGYNFSGWYKDNDLANSIAGGKTGNYTLTAKWEAIPFIVSFDSASGTVVENQIYYYNDVLSGLDNAITTKTGYNFSGWYLGDVLYTAVSRMPAKNITLTAKWTPRTGIQYQVNHRGENTGNNNYTTLLSSYKMYGTSDSQTVAESGNFAGFSLSGNVNQKIIEPDGTTVVDIYYNRNVYSIILDNNGGTGVIELTGKYQAPLIVPNPSKSGYEFAGWNPELPMTIPSYNYTGIAMWNPSTGEYKVEFYYQLSDGIYPSMATSGVIRTGMTEGTGSVTAADKTPTMSGYSFDSTNTGNVLEGEIVGDGSLVLKVYFKKQFTVKYLTGFQGTFPIDIYSDLDYGTGTPVFRGNTGSHNPGYTFSGWTPELIETVTGDVNYEAQWLADLDTLYSVEYYKENLSGGYDVWTGMYTGETDTEVTALIKEFTGFTYSGGNQNNITSGVIAGDGSLVLKLFYDRNKYTIIWKDGNSETLKTEQFFYGTLPVYSGVTPTKTATAQYTYTFNNTRSPSITTVTTGATYTAQFNSIINSYFATISSNNSDFGTVSPTSVIGMYGANIEISGNVLTISGQNVVASPNVATAQYSYTFSGWINSCGDFISGNCSITAEFNRTVNEYLIIFKDGDDNTIQSGMIVYGDTPIYSGATPTKTATAQYTYTFNNTRNPSIESVTTGATYTAQFDSTVNSYSINIVSNDTDMGTISTGEINVEYGSNIVESGNKITIGGVEIEATPNPADVQYTYEFDRWTNICGFELVGTCTIQANFKKVLNKYTITWKDDNGNLIDTTMVEYGKIPTHTKPTKPETENYRYIFVGWNPELTGVIGDTEYAAVFNVEEKETSSEGNNMSGGGGRGGNTSKIEDSDNQHGSAEENLNGNEYTGDVVANDINEDIVPLYKWTYENNVTTMDTLENADPDGLLTRGHLAKMVVNYMVNVLGRSMPYDITYNCLYWGDDESSWESDEIRDYATKACAFGVMGINMEDNKFLPNNIVTRAEFGTVMSRVLWGDRYDIIDTDNRMYYEDHLQALKKDDIMTQIANPENRWEIRKWVWLVFRRVMEKKK